MILERGQVVRTKRIEDDRGGVQLTFAVRPRSRQRMVFIFLGDEEEMGKLDAEAVLRELGWVPRQQMDETQEIRELRSATQELIDLVEGPSPPCEVIAAVIRRAKMALGDEV